MLTTLKKIFLKEIEDRLRIPLPVAEFDEIITSHRPVFQSSFLFVPSSRAFYVPLAGLAEPNAAVRFTDI